MHTVRTTSRTITTRTQTLLHKPHRDKVGKTVSRGGFLS